MSWTFLLVGALAVAVIGLAVYVAIQLLKEGS